MTKRQIKDTVVSLLMRDGYDFFTACEIADQRIEEWRMLPKGEYTYHGCTGSIKVTVC